jgi:hypothetical protein
MSALAHLGAINNSSKQKPTLSRHQNAIAAAARGEPYPATDVVSLFILGFKDYIYMHCLVYPVAKVKGTGRTRCGQTPETQGRYRPIHL